MSICFSSAHILLPDFNRIDGTLWSVVACDQYTSEPSYWEQVEKQVGDHPSTLRLMLPEIYLHDRENRIPAIHENMERALREWLIPHPESMIYLERTLSDGTIRRGLIGKVDLEAYDYRQGSISPIRATEGTVLSRIPPRVAVRRGAKLELPHVMLLIDDPERTVIEPLANRTDSRLAYDFALMQNGGSVKGVFLSPEAQRQTLRALEALAAPDAFGARYGDASLSPLLFAVGDGNHSLASAKAYYEELKAQLGDRALSHPARYALAEIVNLRDDALAFEPIYRVLFDVDAEDLLKKLKESLANLNGTALPQTLTAILPDREISLPVPHPAAQLAVGTLQSFLDAYLEQHPGVGIDYIHGEDTVRSLVSSAPGRLGFLFAGMQKSDLFRTVLYDGALPRKTFSMGHAQDKRFYLECRKILGD